MSGKILGFMHDAEKLVRNSNKAINKLYSYMDKPVEYFAGEAAGAVAKNVAEGTGYTFGSAARFGMQTYIAGSAAGRILSGGGVYKDSNGNADIIGIPFI